VNTELRYMYRDASNYKAYASTVFEGEITEEQKATFAERLFNGDSFIPSQVGLSEADFGGSYPDDGPWHEFLEWNLTELPAYDGPITDFIALVAATEWDEAAKIQEKIAPFLSGGILLTHEQITAWAGRMLTAVEIERLTEAIPNSSIPDAVSTIVANLEV
jgi:hypothetical protein